MDERKVSFSAKVREAARKLGSEGRSFTAGEVFDSIGIQTYAAKKTAYNTLNDQVKAGHLERTKPGEYKFVIRKREPEKRVVMWRFFRRRRMVTIEDLQLVSGSAEDYVKEWLQMLQHLSVVRKLGDGRYQLLKDQLEPPRDEEKAARLRELRARKRAAMVATVKAMHGTVCELCGQMEALVESLSGGPGDDSKADSDR